MPCSRWPIALVFGLSGRINLAFGELAAVGSAATVAGTSILLGYGISSPVLGLAAGLAAALFAGAIHSAVGGYFTIGRITAESPQPSLIATVGLSLFLMEYLRLVQSPVTVWLPPIWSEAWPLARAGEFIVSLTPITLITAGIGVLAASGLLWLDAGDRLRTRLAGLCGRRPRRGAVRRRTDPASSCRP